VSLALRTLFEEPTVARLGERVRASTRADDLKLTRVDRTKLVPTSFAQARLWFLDQLEGRSGTYNLSFVERLVGKVDANALEQAVRALVHRHESLRTTFVNVDGTAYQRIHPEIAVSLARVDAASEDVARMWVASEIRKPFDLSNGPLVRAALVR